MIFQKQCIQQNLKLVARPKLENETTREFLQSKNVDKHFNQASCGSEIVISGSASGERSKALVLKRVTGAAAAAANMHDC